MQRLNSLDFETKSAFDVHNYLRYAFIFFTVVVVRNHPWYCFMAGNMSILFLCIIETQVRWVSNIWYQINMIMILVPLCIVSLQKNLGTLLFKICLTCFWLVIFLTLFLPFYFVLWSSNNLVYFPISSNFKHFSCILKYLLSVDGSCICPCAVLYFLFKWYL